MKTRRGKNISNELDISKQDIISWGLKDPFYFAKYILGYKKMIDRIHSNLFDFVDKDNAEKLLLLPRGIFKTTTITIAYTVWQIVKNPNITVLINNKNLGNAKKMLSEIKGQLKRNETLTGLYGNFVGEVWTENAIVVKPRTIITKTPTVSIGSVDHELTGGHYDLIINDDLAGLKDRVSSAERRRTLEFYKSIIFLGQKGTKIIDIGTRWHKDDIYFYILKQLPKENVMLRTLIENDKCIFPEEYDNARVEQLQKDKFFFETQMMNNPVVSDESLISYDELNFGEIPNLGDVVCYIDFAMSKKQTADYTSITIAQKVEDKIYIIDNITERLGEAELKSKLEYLVKKYNIKRIGAESNSFQSVYIGVLKKALNDKGLIVNWEGVNHSTDKVFRIRGIITVLKENVIFSNDWETRYNKLISQLIEFPQGAHDDAPDSLEGLISMLIEKKKQVKVWV